MASPTLYMDIICPSCRSVLHTAKLLGVELELKHVSLAKQENHDDAFKKINPTKKVPLLVDGYVKLGESRAICRYLARKFAPENCPLYPTDIAQRSVIDWFLDFDLGTLYAAISRYFYPVYFKGQAEFDEAAGVNLKQALETLSEFLKGDKFLGGDRMCLADVCFTSSLSTLEVMGYDLDPYPRVKSYYTALKESEFFEAAHGEGMAIYKGRVDSIKAEREIPSE